MSRRKQAKPRLWKREEEEDEDDSNREQLRLKVARESQLPDGKSTKTSNLFDDEKAFSTVSLPSKHEDMASDESGDEPDIKEENYTDENFEQYSHEYLSSAKDDDQYESFLPDDDNSLDSDTLGTEGGSSWASEEHTTSPGSSCATPNSATESELTFTVGVTDATPHPCRFCDKAFHKHSYLKKHEQTHGELMPFRCEYCRRLFKHKRSRDRHIKLHTGDKKYKCTLCDAAFSRSDHLKIHMKTHDNQKPFQCTVCNRGYNTAAALTSHTQNHKKSSDSNHSTDPPGTTFKCLTCSEIFRKPEDLQNHTQSHHSDSIANSNAKIKTYSNLRQTKESASAVETIQTSGQPVHKSVANGENHPDFSSPEKPFPQPQTPVSNTFLPSSIYSNHPFTSLNEFFCELCSIHFTSASSLQKHNATVHNTYSNLGMKPCVSHDIFSSPLFCAFCTVNFTSTASFAEHIFSYHSLPPSYWLRKSPQEQIKPTDLTVSRKSSISKRLSNDEQGLLQRKKLKINENISNILPSNNHQNEYNGPLLCSQCYAGFMDFESFRTHQKLHIQESSGGLLGATVPLECKRLPSEFTCPQCGEKFSSSEEISQHVMAHYLTTSTAFICDTCHKSFERADDLQKHLFDTHAHFVYTCKICNEVFDSKQNIQIHFANKHSNESKVFRCSGCPPTISNIYHSEVEFATHIKSDHINVSNGSLITSSSKYRNLPVLPCVICRMNFANELDRQLHLASHGKQFQCTLCSQSFHIEYLLDKHIQSHHSAAQMNGAYEDQTNEKDQPPLNSPTIRLNSQQGKNLENYESKLNFIFCDICEKNDFSSENELLTHKKMYHHKLSSPPRMNEILENGEECIKTSQKQKTSSSTSSSPTIKYESSRKFENFNGDSGSNNAITCEICEKQDFKCEADLQSHKKLIHHIKLSSPSKVSLHCAYCNENCKSRTDLENHMKSHSQNSTSTGKHKCNICDEICPTATVLAEHKLTHCKVLTGRTCMHCKATINNEEEFIIHMQQHSTTNGNNVNNSTSQLIFPTYCIICRQTVISEMETRMHARVHLQQSSDLVPCSACFHKFERHDLISGICRECYQRHGKMSPFQCPECLMKFENEAAIGIHMATNHKQSYTCVKCKISCTDEKEIQRHVANHLSMGNLMNECRLCHCILPSPSQLQTHLIEHAFVGCQSFTCYHCQIPFSTVQGLQAHMAEHKLLPRPYNCTLCGQNFVFSTEFDHHNFIHLEENALIEGRGFLHNSEKRVFKEKPPSPHSKYQSMLIHETLFKSSNKYNCPDCTLEFRYLDDLIKHKDHFHPTSEGHISGKYLQPQSQNGIDNLNQTTSNQQHGNTQDSNALLVKMELKKEDISNCESEDEQIDVVTTKIDEQNHSEFNKNNT